MTRSARTLALLAASSLAVLGACGDGGTTEDSAPPDDLDPVTSGATPTDETGPTTEPADPGDGQSDGPNAEASGVPPEYEGVLAAVELAVADQGGRAFEVDDEDGGTWEVHVEVGGQEVEVQVSGDGSEIISTEREEGLDATDRAGLDAAGELTLTEALRTAIVEYDGTGAVDEVSIDEDDGAYAWKIAFADDVEIYLDIASGELLQVETD